MLTDKRVEKRFDHIVRSHNDKRLYRGLLLSNKMKVLLISDPTTNKSAAAMDVNTGYMCDPDDLPGLAHFCEHLLFLGTKKYPQENNLRMYLSQNSGERNGETGADHTIYHFDVSSKKLEGALDRFAQLFLAPLFTENSIKCEVNVINSEYEVKMTNDGSRLEQFNRSSARSNHPFSKFGQGNRETLDIIPNQKGINVRDRLLEFYGKYYSANLMTLCVLGKESLDELENMIVNLFSEVPNKETEKPVWLEQPFEDEHFRTVWYIFPLQNIRYLKMLFPLPVIPNLQQLYPSSPMKYITYLIEHQGEGSLLSVLTAKGWCTSLRAESLDDFNGYGSFNIHVDLTLEGSQNVLDIVQLIFQYINILKLHGPVEWIYNEYRDIAYTNFRFKEIDNLLSYVRNLAQSLQICHMKDVLWAGHIFTEWRPNLITQIMNNLTPEKVRIHLVAIDYGNIVTATERWYGTPFDKTEMTEELLDSNNADYNSDLKFPSKKNEFITTKFDIKPEIDMEFPIILEDTSFVRLWYKKDNEFLVPKARMIFHLVSPIAHMDPLHFNLTHLLLHLVNYSLKEYATIAGLQWNLNTSDYGIILDINGYDSKQRIVFEKIIDRLINFKDLQKFEILKKECIRNLQNFAKNQPYAITEYYLDKLLSAQNEIRLASTLLEAFKHATVKSFQWFIPLLFSKVHVECLIYGNVTMLEAIDIVKLIESMLITKTPDLIPLMQSQLVLNRQFKLENGHFLYEIKDTSLKNSCAIVYYQIGLQSTESNVLLDLLVQIISQPFYNTLRTKEQLGYAMYTTVHKTINVQGLKILIQSDKQPQYIEKRINLFIDSMLDYITTMPEEQFEKYKEAVAVSYLEKPKTLSAQSTLYWNEIITQQYNFNRINIEVSYLKTVTRQQLLNFYKKNVYNKAQYAKLSIHISDISKDISEDSVRNIIEQVDSSVDEEIKKINIVSFKNNQTLYPLLKPLNEYPKKGLCFSKF